MDFDALWEAPPPTNRDVAEHRDIEPKHLFLLAQLVITAGYGTVRVGCVDILTNLVREQSSVAEQPRVQLSSFLVDHDHCVVAAAFNGLQG